MTKGPAAILVAILSMAVLALMSGCAGKAQMVSPNLQEFFLVSTETGLPHVKECKFIRHAVLFPAKFRGVLVHVEPELELSDYDDGGKRVSSWKSEYMGLFLSPPGTDFPKLRAGMSIRVLGYGINGPGTRRIEKIEANKTVSLGPMRIYYSREDAEKAAR